ncbi:MAG TPA: ketopantoate reductase C-terminal domain-containing protein [Enhygromyxa sp.]|nr:ketopantoate reductase C-terminal domain-containing protein [Enhygromyxa sp.]
MTIEIIGAGRIGTALCERDASRFSLIDRRRGWERLDVPAGVPILLAVRNDDLDAVLARVPEHRHNDLVFVQNGMLRPWLAAHNLAGATRGLLFIAVPKRGAAIEPGGESPFFGPHAQTLVDAFLGGGLPARRVDAQEFAAVELEKLLWNSCFGLLCDAFDGDVGTVVRERYAELHALVAELLEIGAPALGISLALDALGERLAAYSRSIPSFRASLKEWRWRNGWFVELAAERGMSLPNHERLLALARQS